MRWMIGLDKNVWIRPLNKTQTFLVSLQYFGQWVPDYDARMRQAVPIYPNDLEFPAVKEVEGTFTMLMNTTYLSGKVTPQMVLGYDVRGAWLIQPSVNLSARALPVHDPVQCDRGQLHRLWRVPGPGSDQLHLQLFAQLTAKRQWSRHPREGRGSIGTTTGLNE